MEMTQYQRDFVRMLDSMRDIHKGERSCIGIDDDKCEKCLLAEICDSNNEILFDIEKAIEIVNSWAKEHPFITYEQKYEETFGVKPIDKSGMYVCPAKAGLTECEYTLFDKSCEECAKEFWKSEYKEAKKEGVSE